jgi:hypothetical protein
MRPATFLLKAAVLVLVCWPDDSFSCAITLSHPDVRFPIEKMEPAAVCRVAEVVNDYTTYQILPSVQVPISKALYDFLLDHPPLTSEIVTGMEIGNYHVITLQPGLYHGKDNEGGEAVLALLYQDGSQRVYHLKGSQSGYFIPITGAGVVMLTYHTKPAPDGREVVETKVTVYTRLDNRFLATVVKVLRPLLQRVVNRKLTKGVKTVHRMGDVLSKEPDRVLRQLDQIPGGDPQEIQALRALLLPLLKRN